MSSLATQFIGIRKKVRQMATEKMQAKMERAADKAMKKADEKRDYLDVTGNLYKSTAIGTYRNGMLQSVHIAPGPKPTRRTLEEGEVYDREKFYSGTPIYASSFIGKYGEGGQDGPSAAEDLLYSLEHNKGKYELTWNMLLVAGVDYAKYVETKREHDVISSLREYLVRYFKSI